MSQTKVCPLCHREARVQDDYIRCEKCGEYILDEDVPSQISASLRLRSSLYFYVTQYADALKEKKIIPNFYPDPPDESEGMLFPLGPFGQKFRKMISVYSIEGLYPKDYNDRISKIMVNLANEVQFIGNTFSVKQYGDPDKSHLFFLDETYGFKTFGLQLNGILEMLEKLDFIEKHDSSTLNESTYKIAPKGWQLVQEYQQSHKTLPQGFIAMWFDPSMESAEEKIIKAIQDSGYLASIIKMKEHNNQIVPEILFEIDRSEFVVADLTGGRGGVYYEAGYAAGRDKPVIMCCRDDEFDKIHFDLKQKNGIKWTNEDDLYIRLKKRIESTIGKRSPI